ncbi:hypothetical protein LINPERPRIM_LOCUS4780 [Linum perenne]
MLAWRPASRDSERETGRLKLFMFTARLTTSLIVWQANATTFKLVLQFNRRITMRFKDKRHTMLEE